MTVETTSIATLLEALRAWLLNNPDGDVADFAAAHDCTVEDLSDAWNTYFTQAADFSRNYDIDTTQSGAQSGSPVYSPAPPPHGSSPAEYQQYLTQEVYNYQEFVTINNIEDNSFNQQILAGGDVNQAIDIDNSENTVGEDGVLIRDSELDDTLVNTGDEAVQQQGDDNQANTGDVTASDGSAASVFGDANNIGSGNDNFGDGQQAVNAAQGDDNQQANQQQDNETTVKVGDTTGGTGGAGTGGDGGDGFGGFGGDGGAGGGFGGAGGAGGAGTGDGDGGDGGDGTGGDAEAEVDIDADNTQDVQFN